jgi:hypothetical protein
MRRYPKNVIGASLGGAYIGGRGRRSMSMRVFLLSALTAVVLALAAVYGLSQIQMTVAQASAGDGTRLDRLESVNNYGREG